MLVLFFIHLLQSFKSTKNIFRSDDFSSPHHGGQVQCAQSLNKTLHRPQPRPAGDPRG